MHFLCQVYFEEVDKVGWFCSFKTNMSDTFLANFLNMSDYLEKLLGVRVVYLINLDEIVPIHV